MRIEYRLTLKDYQEASQAHFKSNRFIYLLYWFGSIAGIAFGVFLILVSIFSSYKDYFFGFVMFTCGIICHPSFNLIQSYLNRQVWKSQPLLQEAMNFEFTQEWIYQKSENFENKLRWKIYIKFLETKNLFVLYQVSNVFNIFPKRAFDSDEQIEEFRELLRTKIGTPC